LNQQEKRKISLKNHYLTKQCKEFTKQNFYQQDLYENYFISISFRKRKDWSKKFENLRKAILKKK